MAQNEAELTSQPDLCSLQELRTLAAATRAAFDRVRPLLVIRERAGLVRRCHGELHLGNIVLIDNKPVLFDAIEFDERIATGDVLYDLAFLLMDLIGRGLEPAANIVLNRYLMETQRIHDLDALAALPLFMSVRAAIRAKVTAARRQQGGSHAKLSQAARDYVLLAQRLLAPAKPQLIAVGGLSGTGKSILARALASAFLPLPGAVVLRSDIERKALFRVKETQPLPEAAYAPEATAKVYAVLAEKARRVTAAGYSVIVDAVFARADERSDIAYPQTASRSRACSSPPTWKRASRASAAVPRMHRMPMRSRAPSGRIRSRPGELVEGRCLRHSGGNADPRRGDARPNMSQPCIGRPAVRQRHCVTFDAGKCIALSEDACSGFRG